MLNFSDLKIGTMFKVDGGREWIKVDCMATGYYYNAQLLGFQDTYYLPIEATRVVFSDTQQVILV